MKKFASHFSLKSQSSAKHPTNGSTTTLDLPPPSPTPTKEKKKKKALSFFRRKKKGKDNQHDTQKDGEAEEEPERNESKEEIDVEDSEDESPLATHTAPLQNAPQTEVLAVPKTISSSSSSTSVTTSESETSVHEVKVHTVNNSQITSAKAQRPAESSPTESPITEKPVSDSKITQQRRGSSDSQDSSPSGPKVVSLIESKQDGKIIASPITTKASLEAMRDSVISTQPMNATSGMVRSSMPEVKASSIRSASPTSQIHIELVPVSSITVDDIIISKVNGSDRALVAHSVSPSVESLAASPANASPVLQSSRGESPTLEKITSAVILETSISPEVKSTGNVCSALVDADLTC